MRLINVMRRVIASAAALMLAAGSASAINLEPYPSAKIRSDGSDGSYETVTTVTIVNPYDRILVPTGAGPAVVVYDNGCREKIPPGIVYDVKESVSCDEAGYVVGFKETAIGALFVGGLVAGAIILANNKDSPSSP